MVKYQVVTDNEWLYPDTVIENEGNKAELYAARRSDVCFQVITDYEFKGGEEISYSFDCEGCKVDLMQLGSVRVTLNSGKKFCIAEDYEEVKDFVTRKAPYEVYDVTKPLNDKPTEAGRAAFYVRIDVAEDAPVGTFEKVLKICFAGETLEIPVMIKIYSVVVPKLHDAKYHMVNWVHFDDGRKNLALAYLYNTEEFSEEYYEILKNNLLNLVDMRNDTFMLPYGAPIYDENGVITGFDFTQAERVGNLALECGFNYIMGGFVATWKAWNDEALYPMWDKENTIRVTSLEGYRQLKLYFEGIKAIADKNGWGKHYWQCLVDEPQKYNAADYRALSAICRKILPGVIINDPIETVDIQGALDIWVVKQAIYDKYIEDFQKLQELGEEIWIYSCGFPAGKTMNRVIDLPLTVSRLPMWMCYGYDAPGFLHFGYSLHNEDPRADVNFLASRGRRFPAGNAHIVYPGTKGPWYSVRGHSQRTGAVDFELLYILGQKDKAKAKELVNKLCRNFDDYDPSPELFTKVRKEVLEAIG